MQFLHKNAHVRYSVPPLGILRYLEKGFKKGKGVIVILHCFNKLGIWNIPGYGLL